MTFEPTTIALSLPSEQLELLSRIDKNLIKTVETQKSKTWLNLEQVCEHFSVKESTIRKWMSDYQLPYSGLGEVKRFNAEKIDQWFLKFSSDNFAEGMKLLSKSKRKAA